MRLLTSIYNPGIYRRIFWKYFRTTDRSIERSCRAWRTYFSNELLLINVKSHSNQGQRPNIRPTTMTLDECWRRKSKKENVRKGSACLWLKREYRSVALTVIIAFTMSINRLTISLETKLINRFRARFLFETKGSIVHLITIDSL